MKYCHRCKLYVNVPSDQCPLCFEVATDRAQEGVGSAADRLVPSDAEKYPVSPVTAQRSNFVFRLLLFISIVLVSVSVLVNLLTYESFPWCLIVLGSIAWLWATVAYPIFTKKNIGQIIVLETLCVSLLFYLIELFTKTKGWALEYAMPFTFSIATLLITFIILVKRMKWRQFAVYQMTTMILGLLPALFCAVGLVKLLWPSLVSALYAFLTLVGMFIFADKKYKNEIIKRFHW